MHPYMYTLYEYIVFWICFILYEYILLYRVLYSGFKPRNAINGSVFFNTGSRNTIDLHSNIQPKKKRGKKEKEKKRKCNESSQLHLAFTGFFKLLLVIF